MSDMILQTSTSDDVSFPQPRTLDKSFPVPSGNMATNGGG